MFTFAVVAADASFRVEADVERKEEDVWRQTISIPRCKGRLCLLLYANVYVCVLAGLLVGLTPPGESCLKI